MAHVFMKPDGTTRVGKFFEDHTPDEKPVPNPLRVKWDKVDQSNNVLVWDEVGEPEEDYDYEFDPATDLILLDDYREDIREYLFDA